MSMMWREILSREECIELLNRVSVGRIAITVRALPVIVPVNFAVIGDSIYFRALPETRLAAGTSEAVVAFEIDSYETDDLSGWSVLVQGSAHAVTDEPTLVRVAQANLNAWALPDQSDQVVRVEMSTISGRRFAS